MATTKTLFLKIDNQTVGTNGLTSNGFTTDEIFLVIQGKINGIYNRLDWTTGKFTPMSTSDNTINLNLLGLTPGVKYANYGKKLSEILQLSWVKNGQIQIPIPVEGGRAYISFKQPVFFKINPGKKATDPPAPAEPADEVSTDPNFGIVWDKFEFTVSKDAKTGKILQLWSNTSCVDFVGIPMSFELKKGTKLVGKQGFDSTKVSKTNPMGSIAAAFNGTDFDNLVTPQRIYAPKVSGTHFGPNFGQKGNYIDNYLDFCWDKYRVGAPNNKTITLSNFINIPATEHKDISTDADGEGVKWTAVGSVSGDTLSFSLTSLTLKKGKSISLPSPNKFSMTLLPPINKQSGPDDEKRTTSYDTMRQGGIFTKDEKIHTKEYTQAIDGDIKNQVSTALNRSVMHIDGLTEYPAGSGNMHLWADPNKYYQANGLSRGQFKPNIYAKILHNLSLNNKCYALAYDDKYDQHVNLGGIIDSTPSTLTLSLFYKKEGAHAAVSTWPSPAMTTTEVLAGIEPESSTSNGVAVIWLKLNPTTLGKTLDSNNIFLMFEKTTGLNTDKYPASQMSLNPVTGRFEVKFIPTSFNSPFRFYFKYRFTPQVQPQAPVDHLLPSDAISGNNPFEYS